MANFFWSMGTQQLGPKLVARLGRSGIRVPSISMFIVELSRLNMFFLNPTYLGFENLQNFPKQNYSILGCPLECPDNGNYPIYWATQPVPQLGAFVVRKILAAGFCLLRSRFSVPSMVYTWVIVTLI